MLTKLSRYTIWTIQAIPTYRVGDKATEVYSIHTHEVRRSIGLAIARQGMASHGTGSD